MACFIVLGCGQPPASMVKCEDSATEERIAMILSEAQAAMQAKDKQDNVRSLNCN